MKQKFLSKIIKSATMVFASVVFFSCKPVVTTDSNSTTGSTTDSGGEIKVQEYGESVRGQVTYYSEYDSKSVAYYVPELESGWFKCAVSENKIKDYPPNTALELTYNGNKIHVLVTDLCPNEGANVQWVTQSDYYFDLGENAFESLIKNKTLGHDYVDIKKIAYPTSKNIFFEVKDGCNEWWLAGRFYNLRYPLKKVEISMDGKDFKDMSYVGTLSNGQPSNNWFKVDGSNLLSGTKYFRLTDVQGHTIISKALSSVDCGGKYDLGKNFEY